MVRSRTEATRRDTISDTSPTATLATVPPPETPPVQPPLPAPSVTVPGPSHTELLQATYQKRARFNASTGILPAAERELDGCLLERIRSGPSQEIGAMEA
ncbi:UNVERIFIED_CONTAM: hypothetical protein Sradi_5755200 [Sesamum radiatum]|uniref:Uncharacterized protein n=1 Tax=Sesamum radiatum TaxID=300843 RepID=A0AAW2L2M8_SESRA